MTISDDVIQLAQVSDHTSLKGVVDVDQLAWSRRSVRPGKGYDRPMTLPVSKTAAGSVGTVETQFLDLPQAIALDCGRERWRWLSSC